MFLVVLGLGALVFYLARKAPANPNNTGSVVGPDPMISATGANWVQSPATANGNPNINNANSIRLDTTYQNAPTAPGKVVSDMVPNRQWKRRRAAMDNQADYLTDANNMLMTQTVAPVVTQTTSTANLTKV
jgi:hypothetical protein